MGVDKKELKELYLVRLQSAKKIAVAKGMSEHKIHYWLNKHQIKKRSISEAIYHHHNPHGDPFIFTKPQTKADYELWGLGVGLYWGEGNKANKNVVKLGNSNPALIRVFMAFLLRFFRIKKEELKFHLHTFTDIDLNKAIEFWENSLSISREQFYKPTITITGKLGNYKTKSEYGVLTLYYGNTKVRDIIVNSLPS